MEFARSLFKRRRIDPGGVLGEINSIVEFNESFLRTLVYLGGNYYEGIDGRIFEITQENGIKRMTRLVGKTERSEIEKRWPKAE